MYVTIASFIEDYRNEAAATQKLLDKLTDESLSTEVLPGYRSLGHLAWHLVPTGGILQQLGLKAGERYFGQEAPGEAAAISRAYAEASGELLREISEWPDQRLLESLPMFGLIWQKGYTLNMFVKHEVHHRGQLTVLIRQAGLQPSGVYGPTKDEWLAMGVPAKV
ncbi:DinB family protein [Paenibacillus athensensis]|uniref:Damage-inducible protein DinB n=1 Tax=Paenibacillus athensensis TaxID=1967502 RepID=A0A4Y8Q9L8_9BACL|nr:DinB family protein [Paenibacillus athensensis]MCD1260135.1 DinB family protein [Paenibacillus athensensis]